MSGTPSPIPVLTLDAVLASTVKTAEILVYLRVSVVSKGGKVVLSIVDLCYDKSIWVAITKEQGDKAMVLHQVKSAQRMTKAAMTMGSNISISEVSDKINKLAHAVKIPQYKERGLQLVIGPSLRILPTL